MESELMLTPISKLTIYVGWPCVFSALPVPTDVFMKMPL